MRHWRAANACQAVRLRECPGLDGVKPEPRLSYEVRAVLDAQAMWLWLPENPLMCRSLVFSEDWGTLFPPARPPARSPRHSPS